MLQVRDTEAALQEAALDQVDKLLLSRAAGAGAGAPPPAGLAVMLAALTQPGVAPRISLGRAATGLAAKKRLKGKQVAAGLQNIILCEHCRISPPKRAFPWHQILLLVNARRIVGHAVTLQYGMQASALPCLAYARASCMFTHCLYWHNFIRIPQSGILCEKTEGSDGQCTAIRLSLPVGADKHALPVGTSSGAWLLLAELSAVSPAAPTWQFLEVCICSLDGLNHRQSDWLINCLHHQSRPSCHWLMFKQQVSWWKVSLVVFARYKAFCSVIIFVMVKRCPDIEVRFEFCGFQSQWADQRRGNTNCGPQDAASLLQVIANAAANFPPAAATSLSGDLLKVRGFQPCLLLPFFVNRYHLSTVSTALPLPINFQKTLTRLGVKVDRRFSLCLRLHPRITENVIFKPDQGISNGPGKAAA